MKTFVAVAALACVTIVLLAASQTNAEEIDYTICHHKPALRNPNDVNCDRRPNPINHIKCIVRCHLCYKREELSPQVGCLERRRCVCLENGDGNETTTATPPETTTVTDQPTTTEDQPSTTASELPATTVSEDPTTTSSEPPSTEETTLPQEESTTV